MRNGRVPDKARVELELLAEEVDLMPHHFNDVEFELGMMYCLSFFLEGKSNDLLLQDPRRATEVLCLDIGDYCLEALWRVFVELTDLFQGPSHGGIELAQHVPHTGRSLRQPR